MCFFHFAQRHYSQLKDELLKLKGPAEDSVAESVAATDLVPSDTAHSITVNGDPVSTNESVADGSLPADEMQVLQDASSALLPTSAASAAAESSSSTAVNDAVVDSDSLVTDGSSAAVA